MVMNTVFGIHLELANLGILNLIHRLALLCSSHVMTNYTYGGHGHDIVTRMVYFHL